MDSREFKGLELAAKANIRWSGTYWLVPSQSSKGNYRVSADVTICTCEDHELTGQPCKHIYAARFVRDRNRGKPVPMPTDETEVEAVKPKRPTYRQQWPAYNAAQCREKDWFLRLLSELVGTVPEPPRKPGAGRNRVPLRAGLFAAVFKVYSGFSGRRFSTDLRDAHVAGHVGAAPHYNSVFRVLEDEAVTPVLHRLVIRASLPLRAVETDFAIDSSGFGTSKFARWFDTKHGVERVRAEWVKAHLCVGVNTHVVTAVEISDRHDGQALPGLVATTAQNFPLGNVVADKAYLSHDNVDVITDEGGTPYIPFKTGNRGDTGNETWARMYHLFALERDRFLAHYHQRSNVESAFSMIKRKFGDSVRSKTPTAMRNEVLAKLVCHNVVCCIHEAHELGIDVRFGDGPGPDAGDGEEPRLLRFPGA